MTTHKCKRCGHEWTSHSSDAAKKIEEAEKSNKTGPFCGLCLHLDMAVRYADAQGRHGIAGQLQNILKLASMFLLIFTLTAIGQEAKTNIFSGQISTPERAEARTNLDAKITVCTITNLTSGDNQTGCATCNMLRANPTLLFYHPLHDSVPYSAATERWTVSNLVHRVTLSFEWNGQTLEHTDEKILVSVTNRWRLESDWKPVIATPLTNQP